LRVKLFFAAEMLSAAVETFVEHFAIFLKKPEIFLDFIRVRF